MAKSLLPQEEADKITVDNVEGLLPEDNYMKGIKGITLVFMSDRWLLKQLKKYPKLKLIKTKRGTKCMNIYVRLS